MNVIKSMGGLLILLGLALAIMGNKFGWFTPDNEPEARLNCPVFNEGCVFHFEEQAYQVKSLAPLNANKPVQLQLTGKARVVHASWQMQGMEMGPNNYRLISNDQLHWSAQTALPMCTNKRQDWLLKLNIDGRSIHIATVSH